MTVTDITQVRAQVGSSPTSGNLTGITARAHLRRSTGRCSRRPAARRRARGRAVHPPVRYLCVAVLEVALMAAALTSAHTSARPAVEELREL